MLVVGDREMESGSVAVRTRDNEDRGPISLDAFRDKALELISSKSLEL